jgi:hypothetical protein
MFSIIKVHNNFEEYILFSVYVMSCYNILSPFIPQGLSFLEMKYHMLLSYLINLTYVVLRKCSGKMIEGDPAIGMLLPSLLIVIFA